MRVLLWYTERYPSYAKTLAKSFLSSNPANTKLAMISQLKQKCVNTLESLLDGDDGESLKFIARYINESTITNNITAIYEKYKILYKSGKNYKKEVFDHLG